MHVHLSEPQKLSACGDLIQKLDECHNSGFFVKYLGGCNKIRRELDRCLRQERLDRTAKNKEASKHRKERHQQTLDEYDV
ncbi:hypothetical protein FRC03_012860 [Tulasnella sp. 419]|nr:hypothetical protein FRC03_012860 [Tulasnella sp. 419]